MTSRDFCYWLQGFLEVSKPTHISEDQTIVIKNHLNMVFKHEIDPSHGDLAHQKALSEVHQGQSGGSDLSRAIHASLAHTALNC